MSHGNGQVRRDGEVIAHFEYNGTVDVACPELYASFEAMKARWRVRDRPWRECRCGQPPDHVELWTDYGGGIGPWPALACMTCMCIVGGEDPYEAPVQAGA